jgi:Na+:H+ antiporter, NhaA family
VPVFGFANAGVSFAGLTVGALLDNFTLGVALGLLLGKPIGVYASAWLTIRLGFASRPMGASLAQCLGISLLCGIGFTMSLFIGMLAFANDPRLQEEVKIGILGGSLLAGLAGGAILRIAPRGGPQPTPRPAQTDGGTHAGVVGPVPSLEHALRTTRRHSPRLHHPRLRARVPQQVRRLC